MVLLADVNVKEAVFSGRGGSSGLRFSTRRAKDRRRQRRIEPFSIACRAANIVVVAADSVLVWQPALSLYLLLGSLPVAFWRARSSAPLLVWVPALCNTLVWLVLAESPGLRFQWPVVLLAPLLACLATADWRRARACLHARDGAA